MPIIPPTITVVTGISSIMSTAAAGMYAATQRSAATAQTIASPGGLDSLPQSAADLSLDKLSFKADAMVFKTADKMLGTLLDIVDTNARQQK